MPAGQEKELYPVQYWRLKVGGGEADGLFMSAQLPNLSFSEASLKHVGAKASPETTTMNVDHMWSPLSLTRGVDKKGTLWKWIEKGLPDKGGGGGVLEKKEIIVELCNSKDQPVQTWTFTGAWPSNYTGPGLASEGGGYAVETISFQFDTCAVKYSG